VQFTRREADLELTIADVAVQIVTLGAGTVCAQRIVPLCCADEAERELSFIVLLDYQRIRTVQATHPSVADFDRRVAAIQADMDWRKRCLTA
jgi:hypothetical protein